jgi:hypothetical protein
MSLVDRVKHFFSNTDGTREQDFFEVGFHGDEYLLTLVDHLIDRCDWFVETGTNVGSTLAYVGRTYPDVQCISCEPDSDAAGHAKSHTENLSNVQVFEESAQTFLDRLDRTYDPLFSADRTLFWVDAHGYGFQWPLREEIAFLSERLERGYVLIDDFKVPGREEFGYGAYEDQVCSYEYIRDDIAEGWEHTLYYPGYTEHTSDHHPLRGWGLFAVGEDKTLQSLPKEVRTSVLPAEELMGTEEN